MASTIVRPTQEEIGRALIGKIVADLSDSEGEINSVLPAGISIPLDESTNEGSAPGARRYKKIKFGDWRLPPDGGSILIFPASLEFIWAYTGGGRRKNFGFHIFFCWNSPPNNFDSDTLGALFCNVSEALERVLGFDALAARPGGGWNFYGTDPDDPQTAFLLSPEVDAVQSLGLRRVDAHQVILYSQVLWTCFRNFG